MRLILPISLSLILATLTVGQTVPAPAPVDDTAKLSEIKPQPVPVDAPATPSPVTPAPDTTDAPAGAATNPAPAQVAPTQEAPATAPNLEAQPAAATEKAPAQATQSGTNEMKPGELRGKVENGRYFSPTHAFDIAVPMLVGDRPAVLDNPDIVVFRDDVRTMLSIATIQMAAIDKWELDTTSHREFLIKFFRESVLADFNESFPGTTVESARLIPDLEGGALIVSTLHPNGSAFQVDPIVRNAPNTPKPVAKRGNLIFCHGDHVFVISCELADRVTESSTYSTDTETEDRILRDRLLDVHSQMHFADTPVAETAAASPQGN